MNRWLALILLLIISAALALRVAGLGRRPMHGDEGVNAMKFGELWGGGSYKYDPHEFHGPSLPYASLAFERLTGAADFKQFTEARLRAVPLLFGLGLILLLPLVSDGLGRKGMLWAALFTAVSPAMVFYSRYYIHEMLLVFFSFLALASGWRYWRSRKIGWALLAGAAIGLMHATKETFIITLFAGGIGLGINYMFWARERRARKGLTREEKEEKLEPPYVGCYVNWRHIIAGGGVWLGVAMVLFSSFFSNGSGPLDSIRTYLPWLHRAGGDSPHIQPWHFYFHRLLCFHVAKGPTWTEALIFGLAIIGAGVGFARKKEGQGDSAFVRFLAIYTIVLTSCYCLLAYKTPWCLLSFWHGMILLAGVGAAAIVQGAGKLAPKCALGAVLLAGSGHLAWQAWLAGDAYAADQRNPYVYGHTSPDLLKLIQQVEALSKASPQGDGMLVKVMAPDEDYWPLPWYLRRFTQVGWWKEVPKDPFAPVMIVSSTFHAALDGKHTHVMAGYFALRPQAFFELYVDLDLWKAYLARNPPNREE